MEERKMTIARGLTRLKTIKAQIDANNAIIRSAVVSSKKKSSLVDTKMDLPANHAKAKQYVEAALQSNKDLAKEFIAVKLAMLRANLSNTIEVAGKVMTLAEAMILRREISNMYGGMVNSYAQAVNSVNAEVQRYNDSVISNANMSAEDKKVMMAEVVSFLSFDQMQELTSFVNVFLREVDGTLNEVNALTEITI